MKIISYVLIIFIFILLFEIQGIFTSISSKTQVIIYQKKNYSCSNKNFRFKDDFISKKKIAVASKSAFGKKQFSNGSIKEQVLKFVFLSAQNYRLPPQLILAVIKTESNFIANAVSPVGACGLMQLMPKTAADLGIPKGKIFDIHYNIDAGSRYLKNQMDKYNNNLALALAAYNAGPGAVDLYGSMPPYADTKNYVKNVIRIYNEFKEFSDFENHF